MKIHPSQFHHYGWTQQQATVATWGLILAIVGLLVGGTFARPPGLKVLLFGLAAGLGLTSRAVRKIAISHERLNADLEDISLTAFQEWAYKSMRMDDAATVLEAEVVSANDALDVPILDPAEASRAHHTIISGPTGAGKSELVKWLVGRYFQGASVRIYDCDARPQDWQGLEVIGRQGDFIGISGAMVEDLELLDQRCQLLGRGKDVGGEEVRICEELPTVSAELTELTQGKTSVATNWLKRIARRGRKYRIKLILITQETSVAAMGIEGEGTIRKAFTIFYLGAAALEQADKLRSKDKALAVALLDYLKRCDRPCLVDHKGKFYAVNIPELPTSHQQFQPAPAIAPRNEARNDEMDIRNKLEMLFQKDSGTVPEHPEMISENPQNTPEIAPDRAKRVREMKQAGLSQTQIIQIEWGAKPGDNQRYRDAVAEYRRIIGE